MSAAAEHRAGFEPIRVAPDAHPTRPRVKLPPLAYSHFHVFGPSRVFPYAKDRPFTPPDAPKEALFARGTCTFRERP